MSILDNVKKPDAPQARKDRAFPPGQFDISLEELEQSAEIIDSVDILIEEVALKIDTVPRTTLLTMLQKAKLDEEYSFNVRRTCGHDYIQAMRAVLVRVRAKAMENGRTLEQWKLLVVSIVSEERHDIVTLVRSKTIKRLHTNQTFANLVDEISRLKLGE